MLELKRTIVPYIYEYNKLIQLNELMFKELGSKYDENMRIIRILKQKVYFL